MGAVAADAKPNSETNRMKMRDKRSESASAAPKGDGLEGYIGKEEVGKRLGLRPRTVNAWMRRGLLPYYKFGKMVRFKWEEIQAHLAQKCRVCRELTKAGIWGKS